MHELTHLATSDDQIVTKFLEDFKSALDKALVVVLIVNDQQVMLLLIALPNSWHTFSMTQRSVPNLFLINLMVISYKKIL
jgi:hypothetical protein